MHYFAGDEASSSDNSEIRSKEKAPLLFDQETYYEAKREFYNYNVILAMTGNKGLIKVPLSCLLEYKGVLIYCRAAIPDSFDKVLPHQYESQVEALEHTLKMRFIFNSIGLYKHPQNKYFLLWDLDELIPRMPTPIHPPAYFRKEMLLQNDLMIEDQRSLNTLYSRKIVDEAIPDFLAKMESLETWVINSEDLLKSLHKDGLSMGNLPELYAACNFPYLKRVFASEMVNEVFHSVLRS